MKILTFLAERFAWTPFSQTLEEVDTQPEGDALEDAVVAFLHIEAQDQDDERRPKVFRRTLKHLKWLANKKSFKHIALHSFTHLGADNADADFAQAFFEELQQRLENTGYTVKVTPFGWFCSWELKVYGESLAKVWKEF